MKISAILFDFDDTLVHSSRAYDIALRSIQLGLEDQDYIRAREMTKRELPPAHVSARNRLIYFKNILEAKKQYSSERLLAMMGRYESALAAEIKSQWQALQRDQLFSQLSSYRKFIVTNENLRTQTLKLKCIDPSGTLFESMLTSEEVGVEKPGLKIFQALIDRNQLRAEECLFVGDQAVTDLVPAKSLGMWTVRSTEFLDVEQKGDVATSGSFARVNKLDDLPRFLRESLGE